MSFSDWAATIVPVVKGDDTIRICGDYKLTVTAVTKTDSYLLSRIEDILASLSNGKTFTKLDFAHAYQQIPVAEDAKKLTTVTTHKGLFRYTQFHLMLLLPQHCSSVQWIASSRVSLTSVSISMTS